MHSNHAQNVVNAWTWMACDSYFYVYGNNQLRSCKIRTCYFVLWKSMFQHAKVATVTQIGKGSLTTRLKTCFCNEAVFTHSGRSFSLPSGLSPRCSSWTYNAITGYKYIKVIYNMHVMCKHMMMGNTEDVAININFSMCIAYHWQ